MVTGQFAMLAGIAPREIEVRYLAAYADAFNWVELPNTHYMAIFADGGRMPRDFCGRWSAANGLDPAPPY